jgi:hypothetical protein
LGVFYLRVQEIQKTTSVAFCIVWLIIYFNFLRKELRPKGKYSGQVPMKLVRIKTAARKSPTMAIIPLIIPVIYKPAITNARVILTILSVVPIFFFIGVCFD